MIAICVDPARINEFWPHVRHLIKSGFDAVDCDDTFEETEQDVLSGISLLWLATENDKIFGAVVTKLTQSRKKICWIKSVGGDQLEMWLDCLKPIEAYAKAEHCDIMRLSGRRGWKRVFKDYSEPFIVLDKRL